MNKVNIMKKALLLIMCLFLVLPFMGCARQDEADFNNKIIMQVVADRDSISQIFVFPANTKHFGQTADEATVKAYTDDLVDRVTKDVWRIFYTNYITTYLHDPDEKYAPGGKEFAVSKIQYNETKDIVEFKFTFNSSKCWDYYHPSSEEGSSEQDVAFVVKSTSEGVFPFSQELGGVRIGDKFADIISSVQLNHFSQDEVDACPEVGFLYDYVTYHKRVHSNADIIESGAGNYHHIWQSDRASLQEEKTVSIYTVSALREWWYLLVLGITLVGVAAAWLGIWLLRRNKNKKVVKKEG